MSQMRELRIFMYAAIYIIQNFYTPNSTQQTFNKQDHNTLMMNEAARCWGIEQIFHIQFSTTYVSIEDFGAITR